MYFERLSSDFNPRPREEGDVTGAAIADDTNVISIHALVKRATFHLADVLCAYHISIHALVKRATVHPVNFCCWKLISIHALVKRATIFLVTFLGIVCYFNPRPREEGDPLLQTVQQFPVPFQSTPS